MRNRSMLAVAAAAMLAGCGQPPAAWSGNTVAMANDAADRGTPAGTADSATGAAPIGGTGPLPVDAPLMHYGRRTARRASRVSTSSGTASHRPRTAT